MSRQTVAGAYAEAENAKKALKSHEDICAVRYASIHETLGELKKLVWGMILGGGGLFGVSLLAMVLRGSGLS